VSAALIQYKLRCLLRNTIFEILIACQSNVVMSLTRIMTWGTEPDCSMPCIKYTHDMYFI